MLDLGRLPLSRKQLRCIGQATARINLWHGSVRSGKTIASLLAFVIAVATAGPSGLIIVCGRSLQTIERNLLEPLQDRALFGPLARHIVHTRGATTATILGRTVNLLGAAEGRLRGHTAQLAYVDEATLVPEGFWTQLLARLSVLGDRLYATTNPDSPRHWLKTGYLDRSAELNLRAWHFRLADNPSLSPEYVADLTAEYVDLWRRRMIDGAWVVAEGVIYDMWDEARHVVTELPDMRRHWAKGRIHARASRSHPAHSLAARRRALRSAHQARAPPRRVRRRRHRERAEHGDNPRPTRTCGRRVHRNQGPVATPRMGGRRGKCRGRRDPRRDRRSRTRSCRDVPVVTPAHYFALPRRDRTASRATSRRAETATRVTVPAICTGVCT
ncbi:terminase large subunit domain-containing protein [Streptomyces sp. NPDC058308]|uniref:terminase large subunit domain-containing protein n=1 Tax=Streptomyces sp. NPDC058308 TaxID=3346440 RepID=UPI0036ED9A61